MFAHAIKVASQFTEPYVGLRLRENGDVFTTMGAFIVINPDGWILTSGHIVSEILARRNGAQGESGGPDQICAHSDIWAVPGFMDTPAQLVKAHVNAVADVALCRLEPFDATNISAYPVFRDTAVAPIEQGMSVCRLGFPFCDMPARYRHESGEFALEEHAFPVPRFALDGIVARFNRRFTEDGSTSALFIETSTPGLRGQSGGPLLDVDGRVCGIQSYTTHVDLGFDAHYTADTGLVTERQFLNVGAATHVDEVRALFNSAGIAYRRG